MMVNCCTEGCNNQIEIYGDDPENLASRMKMYEAGWGRGDDGGYLCCTCQRLKLAQFTPSQHFVDRLHRYRCGDKGEDPSAQS